LRVTIAPSKSASPQPPLLWQFVERSRDAFGTSDELTPIIGNLTARAELDFVEGSEPTAKLRKGRLLASSIERQHADGIEIQRGRL
jgi:hypothetical protein